MKPFYGIDRTADKNRTVHEGGCFIAATVSDIARQSYEQALNNAAGELENAQLPRFLRVIRAICGWTAALIALGVARSLGEVTLFEGYENGPCPVLDFRNLRRGVGSAGGAEPPEKQGSHRR